MQTQKHIKNERKINNHQNININKVNTGSYIIEEKEKFHTSKKHPIKNKTTLPAIRYNFKILVRLNYRHNCQNPNYTSVPYIFSQLQFPFLSFFLFLILVRVCNISYSIQLFFIQTFHFLRPIVYIFYAFYKRSNIF